MRAQQQQAMAWLGWKVAGRGGEVVVAASAGGGGDDIDTLRSAAEAEAEEKETGRPDGATLPE